MAQELLSSDPAAGTPPPPGLLVPGNIDLSTRPRVTNADGSVSTVRSIGVNIDGKEVLLPTVSDDGRVLSHDDAVALFRQTGKHLGAFDTIEHANAYARDVHEDQAKRLAAATPSDQLLSADPQAGLERPATFQVSNEKDAAGNAIVHDPNTYGTYFRHLWQGLNPVQLGQLLPFPKALGGSGKDNPLFPQNIISGALAVKKEADDAWERGDKATAAIKYAESLVPILGPWMSHEGNLLASHKFAAAGGDMSAFAASSLAPQILQAFEGKALAKTPRTPSALSPDEIAANAFADEHDIPLDAATATGSRFARGVQKTAGESLLGAPVAERATTAQQQALAATGDRLAAQVHPEAVSAEQAGASTTGAIDDLISSLHGQANTAYGRLRELEQAPEAARDVVKPVTVTEAMSARMEASLGTPATAEELGELRRISQELKEVPYSPGKLVADAPGVASDTHYVPRSAGAPVYRDILQAAPGSSRMTAKDMVKSIDAAVDTGMFTNPAKGALEVARKRMAGSLRVSSPILPPGAGSATEAMQAPVEMGAVKKMIAPVYEQMKRQMPIAQQQASPGLKALENIMTGPDFAPLSQADRDLSAVKAIARKDGGLAAYAAKAFDGAVKRAAGQLGPEAASALEEGRSATTAKYAAQAVLDQFLEEPVRAYRQVTTAKDANIGLLRQASELAPAEMPKIGRAWLEDALSSATERGRFDHADRLYSNWQKLGPETKQILFGADTSKELNHFFLLAKRIGENPNPSGTAPTMLKTGEAVGLLTHPLATLPASLSMGALAKLLYTPRGVRALTRLMSAPSPRVPAMASSTRAVVQQAALAEVVAAARAAGVPMELPKAAQSDPGSEK